MLKAVYRVFALKLSQILPLVIYCANFGLGPNCYVASAGRGAFRVGEKKFRQRAQDASPKMHDMQPLQRLLNTAETGKLGSELF